ncbi:hypothetical protein [Jatrophihabitans sp.]|uniref:hypothetical protein n=1 Tax=Jatrophihabitans sp. TaxID=1932789 RepID=UPI002BAFEF4D|nr:hypothetical protein [Jatrophihabitans sp.]
MRSAGRRRRWLLAVALAVATGCHHPAAPTASGSLPAPTGSEPSRAAGATPPPSVAWLTGALENVGLATARFGLHDDLGCPMATLKIVDSEDGYLGVYHCLLAGRYRVRLARSTDLAHWTYQAELDSHASQPTLARLPDGSFVLAVEADNGGGTGAGRRWLRFRHYSGPAALFAAHPDRTFDAPHTLTAPDRGAEGTPNIYSARLAQGSTASRITVGFHYLSQGLDRQARGELTDFRVWSARPAKGLDAALTKAGLPGKHGDRDALTLGSTTVTVLEAQDGENRYWHIALSRTPNTAVALHIRTPGRSSSIANPTVSLMRLPTGQPGLVVTMYLPRTGAARKEAGELIYFRPLPGYDDQS